MNIMNYKRHDNRLKVELGGDFNLSAVRDLRKLLDKGEDLHIDLKNARFVNSEAIIFLHKLIRNQRRVRLKNPPKIFFKALQIMGLHQNWNLKSIVEP